MKTIKMEIELTETEWFQFVTYILWADESGAYYGNKKQFDKRRTKIGEQLTKNGLAMGFMRAMSKQI